MESAADAGQAVRRWFDAAVEVADPRRAVRDHMSLRGGELQVDGQRVPVHERGQVVVIAIGKAASGLAQGARDVLGDRIDRGVILTKYGHASGDVEGFETFEAAHPTPDQAGLDATAVILDTVAGLSADDLVIALISGGGSALLELPREGISLEDMQDVTRRLMHAGAGIHDLNTVRKALSQVKGGGLRSRIGAARCITFMLSDVLGNDPSVIASGPTVLSGSGGEDALEVLQRFRIADDVPDSVLNTLREQPSSRHEVDTSGDVIQVIADNAALVHEMAERARADGWQVRVDDQPYDGDAATLGSDLIGLLRTLPDNIDIYIRGGEATVEVTGDGTGGRNTEMALAAAITLEGDDDWVIASLASDGDDGNSGAAGAIADGGTVERAREAGFDPVEALRRNDSATVFRETGGLVETGPTGTNVNDVYVAVRVRRDSGEGTRV